MTNPLVFIMPLHKNVDAGKTRLYWDDDVGARWRIHSAVRPEGGPLKPSPLAGASHRLFVSKAGARMLYAFRNDEARDRTEASISRQFAESKPLRLKK